MSAEEEVKARRAAAAPLDRSGKPATSEDTADKPSLLDKSKALGAKALEAVKDESRHLSQKVADVGQKAWDATTGAASKLQETVHDEAQAAQQAVSRGLHSLKEATLGGNKDQDSEKDTLVEKPPQDVAVLHVNHKTLDAQLKNLSVDEQRQSHKVDKAKISADQLHFLNQQPSGTVDPLVRSQPIPPSELPTSSGHATHHAQDLSKAAAVLGEKLAPSAVAPTDAAAVARQFDQDMSSAKYNLQPSQTSAPNFKEAKSSEGNQDDSTEDSQAAPERKQGDYSGLSSSSLAPLPQDVQNIKKAVEDSHIWGDIQDAVESVKFRQEEEAEDAKEERAAAPIQQAKEVLKQASHRVLETASHVLHAVSDTASHLLHKNQDKSESESDPAGDSSSKSQTRDAHDGAGPETVGTQGNIEDKGELSKTAKSQQGEQRRKEAVDDARDAIKDLKQQQQGSQHGEEGKKRKREGEYEPSADAGAHDEHKVVDARKVQDIQGARPDSAKSPARKQARCDDNEESLDSALIGVIANCEKPHLDRQHSGSADVSHIPKSGLDDFNSQLAEAKPNEGRMLPASTSEQSAVDHQKPIVAPESAITKNGAGDERRGELLDRREMERSRKAREANKADGTLPQKDKKTPEEAPRAPSEQAAYDAKPDERLEQVKRAEELTRKPCH